MPFDTLTMAAVADELRSELIGGRIQKILQPAEAAVGISIYAGAERWMLLSADARHARVHLSGRRLAKAFATPSPFVMQLRKHLEGARIAEVTQLPDERVLMIEARAGERVVTLVAEIMGKHSNLMLLDNSGHILGALKVVRSSQSRVRPIIPGQLFQPPPQQERNPAIYLPGPRIHPHRSPDIFLAQLSSIPGETAVRAALLGLMPGASPFLAEQIVLRAGAKANATLAEVELGGLVDAAAALDRLYETRHWEPYRFVNGRGQPDVAPYRPVGVGDLQVASSMSAAVESTLDGGESRDVLAATRRALLEEVNRARRAVERRVASLRDGLAAAGEAETVMQEGQLILAYQHTVTPGATELSIPELGMRFPLDPSLTGAENAERRFRRYRKLREAARKLPSMVAETESEVARLEDLAVFATLAQSEAELRDLRRDLAGAEPELIKGKKREVRRGPARYSLNGHVVLVGRNARENEEVTFRLARRDDLWLHARERTGAHVILRSDVGPPPDEVIAAAARLAAHFSEGRSDTRVDVDVTAVRNVRKIPGGPPGRVTYRDFRTVYVEPSLRNWEQLPAK